MLSAQATDGRISWQNEAFPDTMRLQLLDSLTRKVYWKKVPDSSFHYAEQLMMLAQAKNNEKYFCLSLKYQAQLYAAVGDYQAAIPTNQKRIAAYESAEMDQGKRLKSLSDSHRSLANAFRKVGRTTEALEQFKTALRYAERLGEKGRKEQANVFNSMGNLYLNLRNYELAQEKYQAALNLYQSISYKQGIYSALNNLGLVSAKTGDYEQAIEFYAISLEMKKEAGDKKRMANTYGSIGDIYLLQGRRVEAKEYFLKAKALQEELGLRDELTRSLTQLGDLARLQGDPELAVRYCTQSCTIAAADGLWQASLACHKCLYQAQKALGDYGQALREHEAYIAVKDSIFSLKNSQEIAKLEARLTYEKQLADVTKEQLQLESEARRERLLRWVFAGSTLALALLSWFALRLGRLRRRQNQALQAKNQQITEDRELISRQAKELEQLAAAKNRFFTNISHELRTPLTLIISPLEQVLQQVGQFPEKMRTSLLTVKGNANKLLDLVEELLELSRLESREIKAEKKALILYPFIQQVFKNYELLAREKAIQYELHFRTLPDLQIISDAQRLNKIIGNLLHNALKFTPVEGTVGLTVETYNKNFSKLVISVQDTGPGIAKEDLQHIFDRYFQGGKPVDDSTAGIGIGLALARESALLLGGELEVESSPEKGSTFKLNLPIQGPVTAPDIATSSASPLSTIVDGTTVEAHLADHRILIVEDNKELQEFLSLVLSPYICSTANNGKEALEMLREAQRNKAPFQLVVTDLMMPEVDGVGLIQQIKKNASLQAIRIVVVTARHNLSEKLNLLRIGVDDYLQKPFSPEELSIRVANLLKHQIPLETKDELADRNDNDRSSWLKEVEEIIEQLLQSHQKLSAGIVASKLHLSNRQLLRKIRSATGLSTQLYLQECKLQLAHRYLEQGQYSSITEVARSCGFSTPTYFSKVFQERFGKVPSDYFQ